MKVEPRIAALEEELKVLKNEIHSILLDIREHYMSAQNPFSGFNKINVRDIDGDFVSVESPKHDRPKDEQRVASPAGDEKAPSAKEPVTKSHRREREAEPMAELPDESIRPTEPIRRRNHQADQSSNGGNVDLVVIAALTQWADQATAMLGKDRAEALVEIAHAMRRFPVEVKDVLIKLIRLSPHQSTNDKIITTKEYLGVLAQLNNLLASGHSEDALLSILSMTEPFDG